MSNQTSSSIFPNLSRKLTILESKPLPSPIPEHVRAPPGTPTSDSVQHTDSDTETHTHHHNGIHTPHVLDSPEPCSLPGTPNDTRKKSRKRGRRSGIEGEGGSRSQLSRISIFHPSLVLENSGSVARDHLASERTFLAYIRTSLLLASTGVALVQLFAVASANVTVSATLNHIHQFARPLGAVLVIFGLAVLAMGVRRYFLIQKLLTQGKFPVTRIAIGSISFASGVIIIIVFGVLVSARS